MDKQSKESKIIVVIGRDIDGGTGTFISQMAQITVENYEKFAIIITKPQFRISKLQGFNKIFFLRDKAKNDYYTLRNLSILSMIQDFAAVYKKFKEIQPTVILSVGLYSNILTTLIKALTFRKSILILTNHNSLEYVMKRKLSPLLRWCIRKFGTRLFNQADCITFVSKGLEEEFLSSFPVTCEISIIPYGLNAENIKMLSRTILPYAEKSFFSNKPIILSIGRLDEQKDFSTLIRACHMLKVKHTQFSLVIIGEGKLKRILQQEIDSLLLHDTVHLLGWKKNVYPYIKNANIFVLSSNYEGFGYVLLEAMACGLPVISTDVPYGPKEIIKKNLYGILTKPQSPSDMAKRLSLLIKSDKKRLFYAKQSSKRILDFQENDMLEEYNTIILRFK